MENGIDLNEIPGEKAAIGERIQSNFPKKNRSSPRRNNDFVEVEPIRGVQQFIDRFQKPRVHVPEIQPSFEIIKKVSDPCLWTPFMYFTL